MLKEEELISIQGGAIKSGIIALIGAGVVFIIGVINGITRPYTCSSSR